MLNTCTFAAPLKLNQVRWESVNDAQPFPGLSGDIQSDSSLGHSMTFTELLCLKQLF